MLWLPEPPDGTSICTGFDGSDVDDWTALKAETREGFIFTPRYGPDKRPTIWNPAEWGGRVPRDQVDIAVKEIHRRFDVKRGYYDPPRWETDVDRWALELGEEVVLEWATYRTKQMHEALERFHWSGLNWQCWSVAWRGHYRGMLWIHLHRCCARPRWTGG